MKKWTVEEMREEASKRNDPELNKLVAALDSAMASHDACMEVFSELDKLMLRIPARAKEKNSRLNDFILVGIASSMITAGVLRIWTGL